MLVSAKEMLDKAKAGHYAVGQFNINNLEWTKSILQTAQENNSPVILGVSEGAGKYMCGYKTVVGMVNGMLEELKITVPVALHLDHGSYDPDTHVMMAYGVPAPDGHQLSSYATLYNILQITIDMVFSMIYNGIEHGGYNYGKPI